MKTTLTTKANQLDGRTAQPGHASGFASAPTCSLPQVVWVVFNSVSVIDDHLEFLSFSLSGTLDGAGGVGGKREYMKYLGAGLDGAVKVKKAFCGGTLSANPLSCAAGYFTLEEIDRTNACQKAGEMGDRITKGLQEIIAKRHLPFVAFNQGSICHLETVGTLQFSIDWSKIWTIPGVLSETNRRKTEMTHMGAAYMAEGLVTLAGSRLYTSAAYSPELIDDAVARFDKVFANVAVKE